MFHIFLKSSLLFHYRRLSQYKFFPIRGKLKKIKEYISLLFAVALIFSFYVIFVPGNALVASETSAAVGFVASKNERDVTMEFRFEDFESFLRSPDEVGATKAFLKSYPVGTPLEKLKDYFSRIGGKCYTLPRDLPNQLICNYSHPKFAFLPFLPIASTWSTVIWFNEQDKISEKVVITAGSEGL